MLDLAHGVQNWEWSWGHLGNMTLNGIALLPILGVFKWGDEAADVAKATEASGDVLKTTINGVKQTAITRASDALKAKYSTLEGAQKHAVRTKELPDGRIRYYSKEKPATKPGPTRGASMCTEYDPKTGRVKQWYENYDHSGSVIRVHPKSLNGERLNSLHFPPTGSELP